MAQVELSSDNVSVSITSGLPLAMTDLQVYRFVRSLLFLDAKIPLTSFKFEVTPSPNLYQYEIQAADGRSWVQTFNFDPDPLDPYQTFEVDSTGWKLSEFRPHRTVRQLAIELHNKFEVTKIEATFS